MAGLDKMLYNFARNKQIPGLSGGGILAADSSGRLYTMGAGKTYYVENNSGLDTNDGSSWEKGFKTLAKALAVSHANIALKSTTWAARNTIYVIGDSVTEDLTALAQKTDIIGCGSCDHEWSARLLGEHAIGTTSYMGCRFINMQFKGKAAGSDIFTIPTEQSGIGFIGCDFDGNTATACTAAIVATAVESLTIQNCVFRGPFSDAVIEMGAGESNSLMIRDNIIQGANIGIDISGTLTTSVRAGWIIGNYIKSTLACINDASSKLHIIGNRGITLAAKGVSLAGAIVGAVALSLDNRFGTSDANNVVWPANGTI